MASKCFFLFLCFFCFLPLNAQSYADQLLTSIERDVRQTGPDQPVRQLNLTERLYYLAHESGQQVKITELMNSLLDGATHQEARAEIGYFLAQHLRQQGRYDEVAKLIRGLGYVAEWEVLGPLPGDDSFKLKRMLSARVVDGLDREVRPTVVPSYGRGDFWSAGMGHYGFFNANNAIYPNQLAGALFTTHFRLDKATDLRLGLGWENKLVVFINGTRVFEGKADQGAHPDQEVISFAMKKGRHRLTLYLESGADEPNLGFYARLTDFDGNPVDTYADKASRVPRKKPKLIDPPQPSLITLAKAQSDEALASVLLLKEQLQSEHGSPKDLLTRSLEQHPSQHVAEKLISLIDDPNQEWQLLTRFLEKIGPDDSRERAWALTQLGQIALSQERYWEARKYANQALEIDSAYWPAQVLENNTFSTLSLDGQALRNTIELDKRYPGVPWLVMDLSDLYWQMEFNEEAKRQTDAALALRRANTKFAERKISILKQQGDLDTLDAFYAELLRDSPYSMGAMLSYSQFLIINRRFDKAENLLDQYLALLPENPYLLERMGELKLRRGLREEALPYLERSLALRPQNPDLEKLIAFNKAGERPFYEPFRIEETPAAPTLEVSSVVVNIDNTVVKVTPSGQYSTYHQLEYEIIDEQGITELPGYSFSYAPLREEVEVIRAELVRGEQVIHMTKFGRARISDPAYRMYYDLVSYQIAFPPLEVGDMIRLEYRIDDTGSTNIFGDYFGDLTYFSGRWPARQMSYTLIMPRNREVHYHVEKMLPQLDRASDDEFNYFTWSLDSVSPYETESRMPGLAGYMPYVAVSTFNDWQSMASWYAELIGDQLTLDHDTRKIVDNLIDGVSDRMEIVKRIHEYVITHTRYVALEFGIHGYKPYQVNQVNSRQFGDCKDKASLIVAMLRYAGIPADVSIVRTADKGYVHTYPAMLAYFNHAIAYVPEFDLYLDGTAEFSGVEELPAMDQGALTLLVNEKGQGKLTKIPISDNNHQSVALSFNVNPNGSADVKGSLSYRGVSTPSLREYLSIETKLARNLQQLMKDTLPGLDVLEADREGRSINEPITLRFEGRTNQLMQVGDKSLVLPLKVLGHELTKAYAANVKRRFPIDIGVPKTRSVAIEIAAPEGYRLDQLPESLELEDENFSVRLLFKEMSQQRCKVDYEISFKDHRVEPEEYNSLRKLMQAHDRVLENNIRFIAQ